jgi:DNA-binding NarL/FixJ family response regulator
LLAEDHKEMRDRAVCLLEPEFDVIGTVADGRELLKAEFEMAPDVCVIDISMPAICGIEAAARLQASQSRAKIVFLTVYEDPDFLQAALNSGASAYVVKSRMTSDLCSAVRAALSGRLFISPSPKLGSDEH